MIPATAAAGGDAIELDIEPFSLWASELYQPPYSPDLNPIEHAWSKIKALLRAFGARTVALLMAAIVHAASFITPSDAAGWFNHCRVVSAQPE